MLSPEKTQLTDFLLDWVWDDEHVSNLLISIGHSFPIDVVMLLNTGDQVCFENRSTPPWCRQWFPPEKQRELLWRRPLSTYKQFRDDAAKEPSRMK